MGKAGVALGEAVLKGSRPPCATVGTVMGAVSVGMLRLMSGSLLPHAANAKPAATTIKNLVRRDITASF
jgi:hypothetical protein